MTIQDVLDEFRIEYLREGQHHHARPDWVQIKKCPFCGSQNFHLGFNIQLKYFSCWRCGGHSIWSTLLAFDIPRDKVRSVYRGIDLAPRVQSPVIRQRRLKEPAGLGPLAAPHRRYLRNRGFDLDALERYWKPRGISLAARLAWRVWIPIAFRHETVSWTTRAVGPDVIPRYVSAGPEEEVLPHKNLVYGIDYCHHSVIIVEGPLDAWKIGPGAGALFGTAFTVPQIALLASVPRRFICFDNDPRAQERADELRRRLVVFPGITENWVLDSKDPGEASEKELAKMRRIAGL